MSLTLKRMDCLFSNSYSRLNWYLITHLRPTRHVAPKGIALPMTQEASQAIMSNPQWHGHATPTHWINLEYHVTQDSPAAQQKVTAAANIAKQAGATSIMLQPVYFGKSTIAKGMLSVLIGRGINFIPATSTIITYCQISPHNEYKDCSMNFNTFMTHFPFMLLLLTIVSGLIWLADHCFLLNNATPYLIMPQEKKCLGLQITQKHFFPYLLSC